MTQMLQRRFCVAGSALALALTSSILSAESVSVWDGKETRARLLLPASDDAGARITGRTVNHFLDEFYGIKLPIGPGGGGDALRIIAGTPESNPEIRRLVDGGLKLTDRDLGDEGFQLVSGQEDAKRYVVVYGRTPRALKHGCQELVFYRIRASAKGAQVDWPLNVVMRPELAYRGYYMLPCWAGYDSMESWRRVVRFSSELTLNRDWFWLDGFPVAGHPVVNLEPARPTHFDRSPLASDENVQSLIDLANEEAVKFYIGGGWMSWHQEKVVGKDEAKAREYYLAYLRTFKNLGGFYFEPTGEGSEVRDWKPECESLRDFIQQVLKDHPGFEVAIAIGRFNNAGYQKVLSELDPKRAFWWWCWGDPLTDNPFTYYPSVLGWHTTVQMTDIHGKAGAPRPEQGRLTGISTSYDPGMGYGNAWNGGSTLGGAGGPRDFHPHTMPYFSHEYWYRERCWNLKVSEDEFSSRLARRLFDSDMPADAIKRYLALAEYCPKPTTVSEAELAELDRFVESHLDTGTPKNRDTLSRMQEAIRGIRSLRPRASAPAK